MLSGGILKGYCIGLNTGNGHGKRVVIFIKAILCLSNRILDSGIRNREITLSGYGLTRCFRHLGKVKIDQFFRSLLSIRIQYRGYQKIGIGAGMLCRKGKGIAVFPYNLISSATYHGRGRYRYYFSGQRRILRSSKLNRSGYLRRLQGIYPCRRVIAKSAI